MELYTRQALRIRPNDLNAMCYLVQALVGLKKNSEAMDILNIMKHIDPTDPFVELAENVIMGKQQKPV